MSYHNIAELRAEHPESIAAIRVIFTDDSNSVTVVFYDISETAQIGNHIRTWCFINGYTALISTIDI